MLHQFSPAQVSGRLALELTSRLSASARDGFSQIDHPQAHILLPLNTEMAVPADEETPSISRQKQFEAVARFLRLGGVGGRRHERFIQPLLLELYNL